MSRWIEWTVKSGMAVIVLLMTGVPALADPRRVVSTDLCADEYVFRLVPKAHIAALSWLAGDRSPVVSTIVDEVNGIDLIRPSTEDVLALRPDLVVMFEGSNPRLRSHLAEAGIRIVDVPYADSLAEVRAATTKLGSELGNSHGADTLLAQMEGDLAVARMHAANPRVATLIYEPNGYATAGTLLNEILSAAGLANAAPTLNPTRAGTIPVEAVVAAAPRLLILNGNALAARSQAELVLHHPALAALRSGTLMVSLAMTPLLCAGPWSAHLAPDLAAEGRAANAHLHSRT